jgi:hypothetical protein
VTPHYVRSTVYDRRFAWAWLIALVIVGVVIFVMTSHLIRIDDVLGVHGFSIGTDSNYCSIEDKLPVVTCEHAS